MARSITDPTRPASPSGIKRRRLFAGGAAVLAVCAAVPVIWAPTPADNAPVDNAPAVALAETPVVTRLPAALPARRVARVGVETGGVITALANTKVDAERIVKVKRNDTLTRIFKRLRFSLEDAIAIAALDNADALNKLRPGDEIIFALDADDKPYVLQYAIDPLHTLQVLRGDVSGARDAKKFSAHIIAHDVETRLRADSATIQTSLLAAARDAGISRQTAHAFAALFAWQIDFARDIRAGDRFSIFYEQHFIDGVKVADADIVAAELIRGERVLRAIRHINAAGETNYNAPNGDNVKGAFLRTPMQFARVTSTYSDNRYHPILKKWRAHRGVDYGAPRGTPVWSTGDGVIDFIGFKRGYGRIVVIQHGDKFQTAYAHLHRFAKGMKRGRRVRQGEVIGGVGSSGWATGPHLHYEFRVNGRHRDPLKVALPKAEPLAKKYRAAFIEEAQGWVTKLEQQNALMLAQHGARE